MKKTYAIKDTGLIRKLWNTLAQTDTPDHRNTTLAAMMLFSGLRVSDVVKLKVSDVVGKDGRIKKRVTITEQKTHKKKEFKITKQLRKILKIYITHLKSADEIFLFPSAKAKKGHLTRQSVYNIINRAGASLGMEISCHSLRKTFGYTLWENGIKLETIQKIFNHSSVKITMRYIGLDDDEIDKAYDLFDEKIKLDLTYLFSAAA
jgi:integrase